MLLLYLALILTIGQAFLNAEVDASYLEADMLIDIEGIFYSGGGYVSHGEGAALTWGWNKYFNRGKGLADLFSDISVSTNSGGGWFFNDVMYSQKFVELIEEPDEEKYLDLIADYYNGIISEVYHESIHTIRQKTDKGHWKRYGISDGLKLVGPGDKRYHDWEEMVKKFHYMYPSEPVLPLKNCKWTSLFGLGTDYNDYKITTGIEAIDDLQKSSWSKAIPGFIDFTFESEKRNPTFEVQFPILDDSSCSIRKTNLECGKKHARSKDDRECMDNAYCDEDWKLCICEQGYVAYDGEDADSAFCGPCFDGSETESVNVTWESSEESVVVDVDTIKQMIHDSINDPKKYSGPSSCAVADFFSDNPALQDAIQLFGFEGSWQTAPLTKEFDNQDAPKLSLLDGGGEDNCGLTGLVRRIQSGSLSEDIESKVMTIIGMCTLNEVGMLITDTNGNGNGKNYEIFEYRDPNEKAQLQFNGTVMEVYGYKVRTVDEPVNGIASGTEFNIFSFSFPYTTKQGGVCRNVGLGDTDPSNNDHDCPSNYDKKQEDYAPLMSLISGRGEAAEVQIASKFILEDMTSLAEKLGVIAPAEPQTSSIFLDLYEVVAPSIVSELAVKILAMIGFCFAIYSLVKKARKTDEFTPISSGEMEI